MGTRSLTIVRDEGTDVLTLYRQFDGAPKWHGKALAIFLKPFTIVNGINSHDPKIRQANGAGCLAAQIVAHFKRGTRRTKTLDARGPIGNFYIEPNGAKDLGEEYVYIVTVKDESMKIAILDGNWKEITEGTPRQILSFIRSLK